MSVKVQETTFQIVTSGEDAISVILTEGNGGTGPQGNQGPQGAAGTGSQGPQGFQGRQGFQGPQGSQGNQGFQGHDGTGAQGFQGSQGSQGHQGAAGPQGSQGYVGNAGAAGTTGPQGSQGAVGSGSQGFQGDVGPQGFQGYQGFVGQGTTGPQGYQGNQGNAGVTSVSNVDGTLTISPTTGDVIASLDTAHVNAWSAQQNFAQTSLTESSNSIEWNLDTAQSATVTLTGNDTLQNPTHMISGGTYILFVVQDATGSRTLAYGTDYKWPSGSAPTLSTAANAVDILTFVSDGTSMFGVCQNGFA